MLTLCVFVQSPGSSNFALVDQLGELLWMTSLGSIHFVCLTGGLTWGLLGTLDLNFWEKNTSFEVELWILALAKDRIAESTLCLSEWSRFARCCFWPIRHVIYLKKPRARTQRDRLCVLWGEVEEHMGCIRRPFADFFSEAKGNICHSQDFFLDPLLPFAFAFLSLLWHALRFGFPFRSLTEAARWRSTPESPEPSDEKKSWGGTFFLRAFNKMLFKSCFLFLFWFGYDIFERY